MSEVRVWTCAHVATMSEAIAAPYGAIDDAAIVVEGESIVWVGTRAALPSAYSGARECAAPGDWITPGLIDCHTHLVYGGDRAAEFEMRLEGATYAELAAAGGGIVSTVSATRAASEQQLVTGASARLRALAVEGVTTVEIKSGYGLDDSTERKMLRAARLAAQQVGVDVCATYLGAHAIPPEFAGRADAFIDFICEVALPRAVSEGLVDAVDAFCEHIAFDTVQTERVFTAASALNKPVKLHAEQLSNMGGAALAAKYKALSADHLEFVCADGLAAMAAAGTVAVVLPGAFYFLRETQLPPIEQMRALEIPIAIASDSNPGSSPVGSLLLMLNMACTLFRLTPEEALLGVTRNAAKALGRAEQLGSIEAGKRADFAIWDVRRPAELAYRIGHNPCVQVVRRGQVR